MTLEFNCEFCNKNFSTKSNLTTHKNKAKYCISKRNEISAAVIYSQEVKVTDIVTTPSNPHKCSYCNKCFTSRHVQLSHESKCPEKIIKDFEKKIEEQKILFENTLKEREKLIQEKDSTISTFKEQIESLQVKITSIAIEGYKNKHRDNLYEEDENKKEETVEKEDFYKLQDSSLVLKESYQLVYRPEDGYIDVTNLCKAGDKQYKHWKELKRTKAFLQVLSSSVVITTDELLKYQIGSNSERKTWVHPQVAINIAQWISPEFDVQVSRWIYEIMLTGKTDIRDSKTTRQLDQLVKENKQYSEKIEFFERKYIQRNRRVDYTEKSVVYIITTESRELKKEYKIGKTQDLTNRLSTYNTTEDHKVVFYLDCESQDEMNTLEKIVFAQLSHLRIRANREWFCGEVVEMIKTIKECKDFIIRGKK
jgi:hypothetical protein